MVKDRKRLEHFLILRLVIALAALGLVQLWQRSLSGEIAKGKILSLHVTVLLYFFQCLAALLWLRWLKKEVLFGAVQAAADILLVGLLVASTGGEKSIFRPLFFATVLASSTVFDVRGSLVCASTATAVLSIASLVQPLLTGASSASGLNSWRVASSLLTYGLALHGAAFLSSSLAGNLSFTTHLTKDIVQTMGEGLIAIDQKGKVLVFNEEARRLLGVNLNQPPEGKPLESILPEQTKNLICHEVMQKKRFRLKAKIKFSEGKVTPIGIKATFFRDKNGKILGTVILISDLTLREKIDAASKRIAKLEELTEFARSIAHEVRNPLASICGCAEEIAKDPGLSGETRRLADILVNEARRVDGILEEFQSFAKIRAVVPKPVNLAELANNIYLLLKARAKSEGKEVKLLGPSEEITVAGDWDLLVQLFLNIGINALEALQHNAGEVVIEVLKAQRPYAEFCSGEIGGEVRFSDTGVGISEEEITKIFDPFYSTKHSGTGLGLAVAHRIVQGHKGEITVESKKGKGTTFTVWLPLWKETAEVKQKDSLREREEALCPRR